MVPALSRKMGSSSLRTSATPRMLISNPAAISMKVYREMVRLASI